MLLLVKTGTLSLRGLYALEDNPSLLDRADGCAHGQTQRKSPVARQQ